MEYREMSDFRFTVQAIGVILLNIAMLPLIYASVDVSFRMSMMLREMMDELGRRIRHAEAAKAARKHEL